MRHLQHPVLARRAGLQRQVPCHPVWRRPPQGLEDQGGGKDPGGALRGRAGAEKCVQ